MMIIYSVRIPKATRVREHGWFTSFTLYRGYTLSLWVVIPKTRGLQGPNGQIGFTMKSFKDSSNKLGLLYSLGKQM
jgi:hypothetical protein